MPAQSANQRRRFDVNHEIGKARTASWERKRQKTQSKLE
jgi:hypothetical protein